MNEAEAERIVREALLVAGCDCRCRLCGDRERHQNCQDRDCALRFAALDALDSLVAQRDELAARLTLRDCRLGQPASTHRVHGFAGYMARHGLGSHSHDDY